MNLKHVKALFGLILALFILVPQAGYGAATLLPNGENCFSALSATSGGPSGTGTGMVGLLGSITGGSGGVTGTYGGVPLTGGNGSGATANITVSGGAVTGVAIQNPGSQYAVADSLSALSANIGGVVGFSVPISSVSINSSLAGGTVTFYAPATTTFKQTWFNADQSGSHQNTNPVQLDANGCAIIYGTGIYRQILKDSLGNTIWDQLTTDTSANNNTFWAGLALATSTPNAIQITDAGFNATDGSVIQFIPIFTNTSATTLTPSGTGSPISIVKDTSSGAVALTGGEVVANSPSNVVSVIYSASQVNFHLLNLVGQTAGASGPLCGANGLKIVNGSVPNSVIALTADQVVMQTPGGLTINRGTVSLLNINITTGTGAPAANGMDGETAAPSSWVYVWAIDSGTTTAGLVSNASGNGLSPNMPSGYNYKCRLGAMRVDGSGNLVRTLQFGNQVSYTASFPVLATSSNTNVTFLTAISTASFVPPTATRIMAALNGGAANASSQGLEVTAAPNPTWTPINPCGSNNSVSGSTAAFGISLLCDFELESTNIYWGVNYAVSNAGNAASVTAYGWKDKVNAN